MKPSPIALEIARLDFDAAILNPDNGFYDYSGHAQILCAVSYYGRNWQSMERDAAREMIATRHWFALRRGGWSPEAIVRLTTPDIGGGYDIATLGYTADALRRSAMRKIAGGRTSRKIDR
jgi:hypothetical protein